MSDDPGVIRVREVERDFSRSKILWVLMLSVAASLIMVSSVNVGLAHIGTGLSASSADLQWVLSGYSLAFGVVLVPAGRLGDLLGRGSLFLLGVLVFTLASLGCGLALDPLTLNLARVIQGIGAGIMGPQTTGMIQQYYAGRDRARAFALMGGIVSLAVAIGPILAGGVIHLVGDTHGWRASFMVMVPLGLVTLVLSAIWLPFGKERRYLAYRRALRQGQKVESPLSQRIDIDPLGAFILILAVLAIMLPFTLPPEHNWKWVLLVAGLAFGALWVWWESRYKRVGNFPMVDLALFKIKSFSYATAVSGTFFLGSTSIFTIIILYLQDGLAMPALYAGLIGIPNAILSGIGALWAGSQVLRRGRLLILTGLAAMILGMLASIFVVYLIVTSGGSFWWLLLTLGVVGYGQGVIGSCNMTLSMQDVPTKAGGTAGGAKQTVERTATAIGNAIMTAIFFGLAAPVIATSGTQAGSVINSEVAIGWAWALSWAYFAIIGFILVATLIAFLDWRQARKPFL